MVDKLCLNEVKRPNPYKVSWLNKGHQIFVNEQDKVEIQNGNFKDKVLCDIMSMDVCHILLGRPWKFDRKVIHEGRKNQYVVPTTTPPLI